jgi:hypothetical protein
VGEELNSLLQPMQASEGPDHPQSYEFSSVVIAALFTNEEVKKMISFSTSQVFTSRSGATALSLPSVQLAAASAVAAAAGLTVPAALTPAVSIGVPATASPKLPPVRVGSDEAETPPAEKTQPVESIAFSPGSDGVRVGPDRTRVSYDVAFTRIAESTAKVAAELERMHNLTREQGKGWYRASVTAAGAGMCVVAAAVIVLILGQLTTGIVTTVASLVPNALAKIFFDQSRRADDRVDVLTKQLTEYREVAALVEIAQTIEDEQLRNGLKAELVRKILAKP